MALVKFGGGVAGISGKIGGTVYARNKAGAFARNWSKPVNPGTERQSQVRALFGNQSNAWKDLTNASRDSWNGYAATQTRINRLGETYVPSGRQVFLEIQNSSAQAGGGSIAAPPTGIAPPDALSAGIVTAEATGTDLDNLVIPIENGGAGINAIIEAAPPTGSGQTNVNTKYRQIAVMASNVSPLNILTAYTTAYGATVAIGDTIFVRVTAIATATGLRSVTELTSGIVAAA